MSEDGDREVLECSKSPPRTEVKLCDESVDGGKWIAEGHFMEFIQRGESNRAPCQLMRFAPADA